MKKIIIICALVGVLISNILISCPVCVDRIRDLQEPFFNRKDMVHHE